MKQRRLAYVIRVDKTGKGGEKMYGIAECTLTPNTVDKYEMTGIEWKYNLVRVPGAMMPNYMASIDVRNAESKGLNGLQVVGKTGSLTRFDEGAQAVVLSKIVKKTGTDARVIGYRVAYSSGKVLKVKAEDLLAQAAKNNANGPWIQNMMYVAPSGGKAEHLREFENSTIIEEVIREVATKEPVRTQQEKREAQLKFTDEQKEILGKAAQRGIDISPIRHPSFGPQEMKFYISEIEHGINIRPYLSPKYNYQQLSILSEASENGLDMSKLLKPELSVQQMQEIYERLDKNIWSIDYEGNVVGAEVFSR